MNFKRIYKWSEIADNFDDGLILGNGASIAISENFSYASLLREAFERGFLEESIQSIFDYFKTKDFELVLRILQDAYFVAEKLKIRESEKLMEYYSKLREGLIKIIGKIHCKYSDVQPYFEKIVQYLSHFSIVISLNYDLTIYWASMYKKKQLGGKNLIKDCFVEDGQFSYDWEWLKKPHEPLEKSVLLFYQHGNLALAVDVFGNEKKIIRDDEEGDLLATIFEKWENGFCSPLIVTEGTSQQKLKAIRRSSYLSNVYDTVLRDVGESVVIYGSSVSERDHHIIDQLLSNKRLKRIAISVLNEMDLKEKYDRLFNVGQLKNFLRFGDVSFFDAKTCWIYEN